MKKARMFTVVILAAGLGLLNAPAQAQNGAGQVEQQTTVQGRMGLGRGLGGGFGGFVDENGNGINDRLEDDDSDGIVNAHDPDSKLYRGEPNQLGRGFVDENANGVNDRLEDSDGDGVINALDPDSKYYRDPATVGRGMGRGAGRGMGGGFIDEDANGINDRLEDSDGDGVINHLDPDSKYYREPNTLGRGFVDENANGINDRLEDDDSDGVVNALDPDSKYYRQACRSTAGRDAAGTRSSSRMRGAAAAGGRR
ncbi:hypothetical protein LLH00_03460 [bacterium]|nr:hypothetical protein [bacterium]